MRFPERIAMAVDRTVNHTAGGAELRLRGPLQDISFMPFASSSLI
ncbi:MAG TPA: hypothetical protein VF543_19000 [Pyrinomonadaceae bacterium]